MIGWGRAKFRARKACPVWGKAKKGAATAVSRSPLANGELAAEGESTISAVSSVSTARRRPSITRQLALMESRWHHGSHSSLRLACASPLGGWIGLLACNWLQFPVPPEPTESTSVTAQSIGLETKKLLDGGPEKHRESTGS